MATKLLTHPEQLGKRLEELEEELQALKARGSAEVVNTLEALAEGSFRLAVHPSTSLSESLALLHRAFRIDGTNPRYPYHIARLYFVHGMLEPASSWLKLAVRLCPTSHRIWAHVCFLQRELNAGYRNDDRYRADGLLKRSTEIMEAVCEGKDVIDSDLADFQPPKSLARIEAERRKGRMSAPAPPPADGEMAEESKADRQQPRRLSNPKTCRWSGIHDLELERLLGGQPQQRNLERLKACLQKVSSYAATRNGGGSAFAMLAIQWIVCGYPIETVCRIRQNCLPGPNGPSLKLLDSVCDMYDADEGSLPGKLADAVGRNEIPPLLASVVHQRRLFLRYPAFEASEALRKEVLRTVRALVDAQRFLKSAPSPATLDERARQAQVEQANDHVGRLERAVSHLDRQPVKPMRDREAEVSVGPVDAAVLGQSFDRLEQSVGRVGRIKDAAFQWLKVKLDGTSKTLDGTNYSQALADHGAYRELVAELGGFLGAGSELLDEIHHAIEGLGRSAAPENYVQRREDCEKGLATAGRLGPWKKVLLRVDHRLKAAEEQYSATSCPVSAEVSVFLNKMREERSVLASVAPGTAHSATPRPGFDELEKAVGRVDEIKTAAFQWMKNNLDRTSKALDGTNYSRALADHSAYQQLVAGLESFSRAGSELLDEIHHAIEGLGRSAAPENYVQRREDCEKGLAAVGSLGSWKKVLRRVDGRLKVAAVQYQATVCPATPQASEFLSKMHEEQTLFSDAETAQTQGDPAPSSESDEPGSKLETALRESVEQLYGLDRLRHAIGEAERKLNIKFEEQHATFEEYPAEAKRLPPIHALHDTVHALEAEAYFRLAKWRKARRVWNAMVCEDRLNANALKNVALCDTMAREAAATLSSWQAYVELLYVQAIVCGSPRQRAKLRADFHRSFGGAYAPSMLNQELGTNQQAWNDWYENVDAASFQSFIASPGRVRSYVDHKMLEFLNRKLDFRSPLRVLGVTRSEGLRLRSTAETAGEEEDVEAGEETTPEVVRKLIDFGQAASASLPDRVRGPFVLSCKQFIRGAATTCASPKKISAERDLHYDDEETPHMRWLGAICELKVKVRMLVQKTGVGKYVSSPDFLSELMRLDAIPLDLSPVTLTSVARSRGFSSADDAQRGMKDTCQGIMRELLQFIFDDDNEAEKAVRERQYQRLVQEWVRHPAIQPYLDYIDDPQDFYPETVRLAFQNGQDRPAAMEILRRWQQQYPELTGPARLLAQLLLGATRYAEAIEVLDLACSKAFHEQKLGECYYVRMSVWSRQANDHFGAERYAEAVQAMKRAREDAGQVLNSSIDSDRQKQARGVYVNCPVNVAHIYMKMGQFNSALEEMNRACESTQDKATLSTYALTRSQAWQKLANQAGQAGNRSEYLRCLRAAHRDAQSVIKDSQDEEEVSAAKEVREQIDEILRYH